MAIRIVETFVIRGHGVVALTEKTTELPKNGDAVRRMSDGAMWKLAGVEKHCVDFVHAQHLGLMCRPQPGPEIGDEIELLSAETPRESASTEKTRGT